jgi:hypothetical protein
LLITGGGGITVATGNVVAGGTGYFGPAQSTIGLANPLLVATGSTNNYAQVQAQNTSSGNNASTDFVATADNGTDSTRYIDMGINGSGFTGAASGWSMSGANDGYVYVDGGNLTLGTDTVGKTVAIHVGGTYANSIVATFNANSTIATTTAGTMVVNGGASFGNNVVISQGANINVTQSTGVNSDLYVSGKNDKTLIWAHAGSTYDSVIVGNSATTGTLVPGAKFMVNSSDSMMLPVGTISQRPSNQGQTDVAGMVRYSTTSNSFEFFNGTAWIAPSTVFTTITSQQFTPTNGQTVFTLNSAATTSSAMVSINGVVQIPGASYSYTISGTTLTFNDSTLTTTDIVDVRIISTTSTVTALSSASGYTLIDVSTDASGIIFKTGTASATTVFTMPATGGLVSNDAGISVATANTATTLDTFSSSTYRSAKYLVQVTNGSNYQVAEALVITDGTTATVMAYGTISTNGNLGVLAATQSGSNTTLQFIARNATNTVKLFRQYITV